MKYNVRINKKVKYMKVYTLLKKIGNNENFLTKLFIKIFTKNKQ